MTADLTPAQAARLEEVAEALRACHLSGKPYKARPSGPPETDWTEFAVAAIDVMRGATDDGAVGRVLALADRWDGLADASRIVAGVHERDYGRGYSKGFATGYERAADDLRAAVTAPATAEGWTASLAICPVCAARDPR
jgi:hypothetical protein